MSERAGGGGGESRPGPEDDRALVLHEEDGSIGKRSEAVGSARARRRVEREKVQGEYPRQLEQLAHERVPVDENDSGEIETLRDGSISIPLFEEELVVTKKKVLRERVIIRKQTVTDWEKVEAELRRERIEFEIDEEHDEEERTTNADRQATDNPDAARARRP